MKALADTCVVTGDFCEDYCLFLIKINIVKMI